MNEKEYVVTLHKGVDYLEFNKDMIASTGAGDIPNRAVNIANERPASQRNTHYWLTDEEAESLNNDTRVYAVELRPDLRDDIEIGLTTTQTGDFTKTSADSGNFLNWGLRRMISATNPYVGTIVSGGFDYTLSGAGVDIVIQDSGIQADHPEFFDADNVNRVQQIDWYAASGLSGTMPTDHYTDFDGHGTHVAGTAAGKTYGWAKNARIYAVKVAGLQGSQDPNSGIPISDVFDVIKEWHKAKTADPKTGFKRPTVVNMSWGYGSFYFNITGGVWRGIPWSGSSRRTDYGMTGSFTGLYYRHPVRIASVDADVQELIDAGVHVCIAAGNSYHKIDIATGNDYNNYYTRSSPAGNVYYHRGGSPYDDEANVIGNIDSSYANDGKEKISASSERGPGVDVYAPGTNIMSSNSTTSRFTSGSYPANSNFKITNISGTSMASPQVAGLLATYLEINPGLTPAQGKSWITSQSKTDLLTDTGTGIDYTNPESLLEGNNRYAFQPFNSPNVLGIAGTVTSETEEQVLTPTYALSSSSSGVNEGETFTITLTTTNLVNGIIIPYTISGVESADINGASLTGSFIVGVQNTLTVQVTADATFDDGNEIFSLALDNGNATVNVTIADTSKPDPSYFLSPSSAAVDEGGTLTFTLTTGNVATGTNLPYTITGVNSADIGGASLTGNFVVGLTDSVSFTITADELSEGQETITLALNNGLASSSVPIADTSTIPATYNLNVSSNTVNEGGSFDVNLSYTNGTAGVIVPYTITGVTSADLGGASLTGSFVVGETESITFNVANDITTEGTETFQLTLNNYSSVYVQVTIADTSLDLVSGTQISTSSGSGIWVVPSGVTSIGIMAISGGGAGGNIAGNTGYYSSGGGGGGCAWKNNISVTPGDVVTWTVGAGGTAGGAGGSTSVSVGSGGAIFSGAITGGQPGTSGAISNNGIIQGGAPGTVASGSWDGSNNGGGGGMARGFSESGTVSAVCGGGGGAGGMGGVGGNGSGNVVASVAHGIAAPGIAGAAAGNSSICDGGIGAGAGGGHGFTQDPSSGTGGVSGGRGGGTTITIGRSGLEGNQPTGVITQTITGAGQAINGEVGGNGNIVAGAVAVGGGGGGSISHSLASTYPTSISGVAGGVLITWPGNVTAYQVLPATYSLSSNKATTYEGQNFIITATTNLTVNNTNLPYTITGVTSADINNEQLTGNLTPAFNTKTFTVTEDATLEGTETFNIALDNGAASTSVSIEDSSTGLEQSYSANVTAGSTSAYSFSSASDRNGPYSGNNPYIVADVNDTLTFNVNAPSHPFYIKTQQGTGTGNLVSDVTNNGATNGAVIYNPRSAGITYYQCSNHNAMHGKIYATDKHWAKTFDYSSANEQVLKIKKDTIGNYICIAKTESTTNVFTYIVFQLSAKGEVLWSKHFPAETFILGLDLDGSNNIYLVGGQGQNIYDDQTPVGGTSCKALIMKLNNAGVTQWTKSVTHVSLDHLYYTDCVTSDNATDGAYETSIDTVGVRRQANWTDTGTGMFWGRHNQSNGAYINVTHNATTTYSPGENGVNNNRMMPDFIRYHKNAGGTKRFYVAGTWIGTNPTQLAGAWVQQPDKIWVRVYEVGPYNVGAWPSLVKQVTFNAKDNSTDITLGGLDVSDSGCFVTINDTSSGKGEIYHLEEGFASVTARIACYDPNGTTERNVLTDIKADGATIYVTGQQKEDSAKNFTPFVGALNGFISKIPTGDLTTADSRILLTNGNTSINTVYVDKGNTIDRIVVGGQANPSSKLSAGNNGLFTASIPAGSEDHYGSGIGNASSTVDQIYEDWAIGKTGYIQAISDINSNFTATLVNTYPTNSQISFPTTDTSATYIVATGGDTVGATPYDQYKMALNPYAVSGGGGSATYNLARSAATVNEGSTITFTLTTTNVADATTVPYTISGITSGDLSSGSLTGNFTIVSNSATVQVTIASDGATEGSETLTMALDGLGVSTTVTINDTSTTPAGEQVYYSAGSFAFTVPAGVTSLDIIACGAGGGAQMGRASYGSGGGGGGGAVAWVNNIGVNAGDTIGITVGAKGALATSSLNNPFEQVTSSYSSGLDYYPSAGDISTPTDGGNTVITIGSDTVITAGGGSTSTSSSGGAGGLWTVNSSYGTTRGGNKGASGDTADATRAGGGGGAGADTGETGYGGGGQGGAGRSDFYRSSGGYDYSKTTSGGRGGGVELYGTGSTGSDGTDSPALYSGGYYNYSGAGDGGIGSDNPSATVSVGGGAGGGAGGRIRNQQIGSFYYRWFAINEGKLGQDGGVRIRWGSGDFPTN